MSEEELKYQRALNWQHHQRLYRVVKVERLPDCYRLTRADGEEFTINNEWGLKQYPIAICGN